MSDYDALPQPLRNWLAQAALPWSPRSAKRIWIKASTGGRTIPEVLSALDRVESAMLKRDSAGQPGVNAP